MSEVAKRWKQHAGLVLFNNTILLNPFSLLGAIALCALYVLSRRRKTGGTKKRRPRKDGLLLPR